MKTFTRTLNILSLCRQLIFSGICDAFIVGMLLDCISAFQEGVNISANIVIILLLCVLLFLFTYPLICWIRAYLYEKDVMFIVDEQNDSIQFQKGNVVKQFVLSDIEEWYCYHNRLSNNDVYELYLKSGEVIRFSEMIPLYDKYLRRQNKLHRLPPLQVEDSMLRQYIKSSIDMPEGNMY